jgi:GNAT superfamily N-acetyltransferase
LAARIRPVLQQLSSCNRDAISNLLRESGKPGCREPHVTAINRESTEHGPSFSLSAARWMAGVYIADELTSFVLAREGSFEGYVEATLFVDAKWRRQGIGTLLLKAAMDWAALHQASTLRFVCARSDWPMRHFARKSGARLDLMLGQLVADIVLGPPIDQRQCTPSPG